MPVRIAAVILLVAGLGACASPGLPEVPEGGDVALVEGRAIFEERCRSCHGADGRGGSGPDLRGVEERYPDVSDQVDVVTNGRGAMPGWGEALTDDQITAVVRYSREVL